MDALRRMRALAEEGCRAMASGDVGAMGDLLHEGWALKRSLASRITNPDIDAMYETARRAGALGGKICGAGGGGFMLLFAPPDRQPQIERALSGYRRLPFSLTPHGSRIVLNMDEPSAVPA
jgi:D-glycero-alpha-D-manno-heptose-7-phosphate kinase